MGLYCRPYSDHCRANLSRPDPSPEFQAHASDGPLSVPTWASHRYKLRRLRTDLPVPFHAPSLLHPQPPISQDGSLILLALQASASSLTLPFYFTPHVQPVSKSCRLCFRNIKTLTLPLTTPPARVHHHFHHHQFLPRSPQWAPHRAP